MKNIFSDHQVYGTQTNAYKYADKYLCTHVSVRACTRMCLCVRAHACACVNVNSH